MDLVPYAAAVLRERQHMKRKQREQQCHWQRQRRDEPFDAEQQASNTAHCCVVCRENQRRVAAYPCGHYYACHECAARAFALERRCAVCKLDVAAFHEVFICYDVSQARAAMLS